MALSLAVAEEAPHESHRMEGSEVGLGLKALLVWQHLGGVGAGARSSAARDGGDCAAGRARHDVHGYSKSACCRRVAGEYALNACLLCLGVELVAGRARDLRAAPCVPLGALPSRSEGAHGLRTKRQRGLCRCFPAMWVDVRCGESEVPGSWRACGCLCSRLRLTQARGPHRLETFLSTGGWRLTRHL